MWERSIGVTLQAVGLESLPAERSTVENLVTYLLSCLEDEVREQMELIVGRYALGLNQATQRLGILFPTWLVDMKLRV